MKNPAVNVQRIHPIQPNTTQKLDHSAPSSPSAPSAPSADTTAKITSSNGNAVRGVPIQQGQSRAAGLRLALAQSTGSATPAAPASTGVVIKYAPDQRNARRARSEHPEGVMPLDEEIHHLTGEFPSKARETQQRRKQVLAQRRQVDRGFKGVVSERLEHDADLMTDSWGEDH